MNDAKYVLTATCSVTRYVNARSAKSFRAYVIETTDDVSLMPGEEVLAAAPDKELILVVIGYPRNESATRKRAAGNLRFARRPTPSDRDRLEENERKQEAAVVLCKEQIRASKLAIHLVNCELSFSGKQYVFYFTADNRVDFRALVSILSRSLRAKVQMWQIGSRDETRFFPTVGMCGRELCCNCFLKDIKPVSLKCARVQNLSLNPNKITGVCGKLMCCLRYETYEYEEEANTGAGKDPNGPEQPG